MLEEELKNCLRLLQNCIEKLEQESFIASQCKKDYLLLVDDSERRSKILRNINKLIKSL